MIDRWSWRLMAASSRGGRWNREIAMCCSNFVVGGITLIQELFFRISSSPDLIVIHRSVRPSPMIQRATIVMKT
ncbi:hypothetical protein K1719_031305 [Acacia pycnantha]|nr:hypothetical protein K1719_031305 [Acacia pycnantha]